MFKFLEDCKLSTKAFEGVVELLYGDLTPNQALELDQRYSALSDEEKMKIVLSKLGAI